MVPSSRKKILISGGWGYANLGDDAILISTIDLVKQKYPDAQISVMTYNPSETSDAVSDPTIRIIPSIHRQLSGTASFKRLRVADLSKPLGQSKQIELTPLQKRARRYLLRFQDFYFATRFELFSMFPTLVSGLDEFKSADLFIQGGGGYFIEGWKDSFLSRILELKIAHEQAVPILVIGQSIGPITNVKFRNLATKQLGYADILSIRDIDSFNELTSYGLKPVLIPDTVLSKTDFEYKRKPILAILLGSQSLTESQLDLFNKTISELPDLNNIEVRITVSRLWEADLANASKLYHSLKSYPNVQLIIPKSSSDLQNILGECSVLVSQNLHGLILAWRAGCASVCINTKRKFVSFMEQSGQSSRITSLNDLTMEKLLALIDEAFKENEAERELRRSDLSTKVKSQFNACLDRIWKD
ncbi:polysaccharide pyruvyl transferase family protein [Dyadobacter crusticola]|uniref:polysaccharide pyruvyl transferase family protein n=1 Tax=Dyadobacter crusticola TaxID=292407 RepID=UPI0004E1AE15|nr:polysaccharide pyruvyl transferase family protein [Dyadobacter crusticola]